MTSAQVVETSPLPTTVLLRTTFNRKIRLHDQKVILTMQKKYGFYQNAVRYVKPVELGVFAAVVVVSSEIKTQTGKNFNHRKSGIDA